MAVKYDAKRRRGWSSFWWSFETFSFGLKRTLVELCCSCAPFDPEHLTSCQCVFWTGLVFPLQSLLSWPDYCLFLRALLRGRIEPWPAVVHKSWHKQLVSLTTISLSLSSVSSSHLLKLRWTSCTQLGQHKKGWL